MATSSGTTGFSGTARWFALTVRHQHERETARALAWKGLETLAPCYQARRQWSDRMKQVDIPLFGGYVFCRFEPRQKIHVLNTPGVSRIVGFGRAPAALDDDEIRAVQVAVESRLGLWPWHYLNAGDRVLIERGPLRGIEGVLLREPQGLRLVIGIELLRRAVAVELDPEMVAPMRLPPPIAVAGSETNRRRIA